MADLTPVECASKAIAAAESSARTARNCRAVLGGEAASTVDPRRRPRSSKRSRRPLCHASSRELWDAFRDGWDRFVANYRAASAAFLSGGLGAPFPAHSFRPHSPVSAAPG